MLTIEQDGDEEIRREEPVAVSPVNAKGRGDEAARPPRPQERAARRPSRVATAGTATGAIG